MTHISPTDTRPTRRLLRLTASLALVLLVAAPASAQLPALPAADLPGLPAVSSSTSAGGASASAHAGGHAVGACADVPDHHALAGSATSALPAQAQGALGAAQGAAAPATSLAPAAPQVAVPECVELDAAQPEQAVAQVESTAQDAKGGFLGWLGGLFGGLF